jgi:uncharacterized protein
MAASGDAVRIVEEVYLRYREGDETRMLALLADDVVFRIEGDPDRLPFAGVWTGHDGVRQHLELLARDWEATRFDKLDIVAQADKVAVRIHLGLRHQPTGRAADLLKVDFWTVGDGKVVEFHQVLDSARLERCTG